MNMTQISSMTPDATPCTIDLSPWSCCNCCRTPTGTVRFLKTKTLSAADSVLLYTSKSSKSICIPLPLNTRPPYASWNPTPCKSQTQCHIPASKTPKSTNCSASLSTHYTPTPTLAPLFCNTSTTPSSSQMCHKSAKSTPKMHMPSMKNTLTT